MTFAIRVNGEEVWSTENQVDQVSLQSAKGEAGRVGVSYDTSVVDIVVAEVAAGGPVRLDHLEARDRQAAAANREGEVAGALTTDRYNAPDSMNGTQGDHDYTAVPGGQPDELHVPSPEENAAAPLAPMSEDLPGDSKTGEDDAVGSTDANPSGAAVEDQGLEDDATTTGPGTENPASTFGGFGSIPGDAVPSDDAGDAENDVQASGTE